jgi:ketosteroid isomerase-like protein
MKVYPVAAGVLVLMACANLIGCSQADGRLPPTVTGAIARDFNEGDAVRVAANYTDDAQILAPQHAAIDGKPDILAFFKSNIDKYLSYGNDSKWSMVRGDLAVEQGVYIVRNVKVGANVEAGKYIRVWKRTGDTWKLYRDMYSPDHETSAVVSLAPESGQELSAK